MNCLQTVRTNIGPIVSFTNRDRRAVVRVVKERMLFIDLIVFQASYYVFEQSLVHFKLSSILEIKNCFYPVTSQRAHFHSTLQPMTSLNLTLILFKRLGWLSLYEKKSNKLPQSNMWDNLSFKRLEWWARMHGVAPSPHHRASLGGIKTWRYKIRTCFLTESLCLDRSACFPTKDTYIFSIFIRSLQKKSMFLID